VGKGTVPVPAAHGWCDLDITDPEGVEPFGPSGAGLDFCTSLPWVSPTATHIVPLRGAPLSFKQCIRLRVLLIRVITESLARVSSLHSGLYHALHEWRRREALLAIFVEENLRDIVCGLNAYEVQQCERPHGMIAPQLQI